MTAQENGVAAIIAAYNAEATLDRAIESALAQPEVAEVCVVDDASNDRTVQRAQAWAARDGRVKVLVQPRNAGPAAARNVAISATVAPWLAVLDADDYLLPGRTGILLARSDDADFIADTLIRTVEGATPRPPIEPFEPRPLSLEDFVLGNLDTPGVLQLGFLKPLFRRAFVENHGLAYSERLRLGEDYYFYGQALARGARFVTGPAAGYVSVERPGSLSRSHSADDLERMRDCDRAIAAMRPMSRQERRALDRHWTSVDCRLQWRRLIDAVKARDARAALAAFHTPATIAYLSLRLGEQAWERSAALALRMLGVKGGLESAPLDTTS